MPNSSIKNEKMYEDLRKEGNSKEKAARISNAAAARGTKSVGRKGGKAGSYDDWSVADLKKRAKELGVTGYSGLTKDKLIAKLRNHRPSRRIRASSATRRSGASGALRSAPDRAQWRRHASNVGRVGVDHCGRDFRQGMRQIVLAVVRDAMCRSQTQHRVDIELGVGVQSMTDPAQPHAVHRQHPRPAGQNGLGGVDQLRIHTVDEPAEYVAYRSAQHGQDGEGDDQADDRVGERETQRDAAGADQHGERGEPVGAGVQAVGN